MSIFIAVSGLRSSWAMPAASCPRAAICSARSTSSLALLQAVDDGADLVGHFVQDHIQIFDSGGRIQIDRPDDFLQLAACRSNGHVELDDGASHIAGDAETGDQSGRRSEDAEQPKDICHSRRDLLIFIAALPIQLFLQGKQILGRPQHAAQGQFVVEMLDSLPWRRPPEGAAISAGYASSNSLYPVADLAGQSYFVFIIHQVFRLAEAAVDFRELRRHGFQMGTVSGSQEILQFRAHFHHAENQLQSGADRRPVQLRALPPCSSATSERTTLRGPPRRIAAG